MSSSTNWRRGHRSGQQGSSSRVPAASSSSGGAGLGLSGQINPSLARDAALNSAYNELGKELFSPHLKSVGNYSLGKEIGEGSFGSVRLGLHRLTKTRVAIKQIPRSSAPASLTREIHHHRRLHHPNVCQLLEIVATESYIYLVSELCPGGELYDYLVENGRLGEYEARRIIGQLLLAVGYCHAQGVLHRDLKLENVLLSEACDVKLADFGFGREFDQQRMLETFCGTTGYAAPEMLAGHKYRAEVDIWSIGVILYALLTGSLPFDDDDEAVMKQKIVTLDLDLPLWLPEEPRDLLSKILVLNPSARPNIRDILSHPWFTKSLLPPSTSLGSDLLHSSPNHQGYEGGQPPIPEEDSLEGQAQQLTTAAFNKALSVSNKASNSSKTAYQETYGTSHHQARSYEPSPRPSLDDDHRQSRSPYALSRTSSGHSQTMQPHARTPSRTKRRSVSSLHTLSERVPPHPATPTVDYLAMLGQGQSEQFESSTDQKLLDLMDALGLDTGQIRHSVRNNACDSCGAVWWMLKRKQEEKLNPPKEHPEQPVQAGSSKTAGAPLISRTSSVSKLDVPEPDSRSAFPSEQRPRQRPRSNSALPSTPSTPVSPVVSPTPPSTSVPNLAQQLSTDLDVQEGRDLERAASTQSGLGYGQPSNTSPRTSGSALPGSVKPRSSSISILQRATSAITGVSSNSQGERSKEPSTNEQTGRATPLGILFGRKASSSGEPSVTAPPSPAREERMQQQQSGDTGSEKEVLEGGSTLVPSESLHEARNSSRQSLGTSPASSSRSSNPPSAAAPKPKSGRLLSTFKFFFTDDRRRRKRNTAPDLSNFEGSSVSKLRVAPAVAGSVRESPLRKTAINSTSSSTSALYMEAVPLQHSRRSSVSSMQQRSGQQGHHRTRSTSSRQSLASKHDVERPSSFEQSRPASLSSTEGIAPLGLGTVRRADTTKSRRSRRKRSYSQSSSNSRVSDHVASFRRAPTTTTQVRRIRPPHHRRDSTSSSIRSYSSHSSVSDHELEGSPAMLSKDEPVIEEENEVDEKEAERERTLARLSGTSLPSHHNGRERSSSGTIFAAHKSTSVFHSPAQGRSSSGGWAVSSKPKSRNVFASKRGPDGEDEWEDTFEGYSAGFGQANSGAAPTSSSARTSTPGQEAAQPPMLGAGRYAGVVEESMPGSQGNQKTSGFKGMAATVEEEEEEE